MKNQNIVVNNRPSEKIASFVKPTEEAVIHLIGS
jgi:hypothetical protein